MKTIQEMVDVMLACKRGEQIQFSDTHNKWEDICKPVWNWGMCDYRVKPKLEFRPFKNTGEFLKAQKEHGKALVRKDDGALFLSYTNEQGEVVLVDEDDHILRIKIGELYRRYEFLDCTPCGKEVEK